MRKSLESFDEGPQSRKSIQTSRLENEVAVEEFVEDEVGVSELRRKDNFVPHCLGILVFHLPPSDFVPHILPREPGPVSEEVGELFQLVIQTLDVTFFVLLLKEAELLEAFFLAFASSRPPSNRLLTKSLE